MKSFRKSSKVKKSSSPANINQVDEAKVEGLLNENLQENIKHVKDTFGGSNDIVTRTFHAGENGKFEIGIIYTDGLVDKSLVQDFVMKTLMFEIRKTNVEPSTPTKKNILKLLKDIALPEGDMTEILDFKSLFLHVLSGDTVILVDGYNQGFAVSSKGWKDRGVTAPDSQTVVRGPKDSFCETLRINTALIRRRIKDTRLWIETKQIGKITKTDVAIAYINGIANEKIIEEVRNRLDKIDIDGILESGYIEDLIQDEIYTPFPTIYNTERPDAIASGLLEGRIAIIVDGTPFVLLVPALFVHFLKSPEDYYQRFNISSMIRILRYVSFLLTMLTPSLYIALTTFHQEMIPTSLLISIAAQREGVPFPAVVEVLIMEVTFEILREAGVRMPRAVGAAISIVGALVLGEAAVQAGIVSPVMVIVVSITAISSFVFPSYNIAIAARLLRFIFIALGATFGLYGIALGLIALTLHLSSIRSFGIPYMSPMAPFNWQGQKDAIFRFPLWSLFYRPRLVNQKNMIRQQDPLMAKPKPPNQTK